MIIKKAAAICLSLVAVVSLTGKSQAANCVKFDGYNWLCNVICTQKPQLPQRPENPEVPEIPNVPETELPETPEVETPSENTGSAYELQVLELVNEERAKYGLKPLEWDNALANVARAHSNDMANRGFFAHNNPDGETPFDRINAAGINYRSAGENIAAGQKSPQEVVNAWMNSEGHRANILNSSYTKLGVGFVTTNNGYKTYWTQNFIG